MLDRNNIGISVVCNGFSNGESIPTTSNNIQYIVSDLPVGLFSGAKKNQIARYNGFISKWQFYDPEDYTDILFDVTNKSIYRYRSDTKNWAYIAYVGDDDRSHFGTDNKLMYPYPVTCVADAVSNISQYNPVEKGIRNISGYKLDIDNIYNFNHTKTQLCVLDLSSGKIYRIGNDGTITNLKIYSAPGYSKSFNDTLENTFFVPIYILTRTNLKVYKIIYVNDKIEIKSDTSDNTIPKFTDYDFFIEYDSLLSGNPKITKVSSITSVSYYKDGYCNNIDSYRQTDAPPNVNPLQLKSKLASPITKGLIRKDPICSNIAISTKKDQEHTDVCIPLSLRSMRAQFTTTQINDRKIIIKFDKATNPWYYPIGYSSLPAIVRFSVSGLVMNHGKDYAFKYEIGQHLTGQYTEDDTVGIIEWNNMDLAQINLTTSDWYAITFNSMSSKGIAIVNE